MIAHGVPANQTAWLAERLGINSLADLAGLSITHVVRVPRWLRGPFIRLRHANCPPDAVWQQFTGLLAPSGSTDWHEYDRNELQRLANMALHQQATIQGLSDLITNFAADVHTIVSDSDEESSEAEASSATASTERFEDSSDAGGAEDAGDIGGAEDAQIAFE